MRRKESQDDYRFLPEPDLPPVVLTQDQIDRWRSELPDPPAERRARYESEYGLSHETAALLTVSRAAADRFEEAAAAHALGPAAGQPAGRRSGAARSRRPRGGSIAGGAGLPSGRGQRGRRRGPPDSGRAVGARRRSAGGSPRISVCSSCRTARRSCPSRSRRWPQTGAPRADFRAGKNGGAAGAAGRRDAPLARPGRSGRRPRAAARADRRLTGARGSFRRRGPCRRPGGGAQARSRRPARPRGTSRSAPTTRSPPRPARGTAGERVGQQDARAERRHREHHRHAGPPSARYRP